MPLESHTYHPHDAKGLANVRDLSAHTEIDLESGRGDLGGDTDIMVEGESPKLVLDHIDQLQKEIRGLLSHNIPRSEAGHQKLDEVIDRLKADIASLQELIPSMDAELGDEVEEPATGKVFRDDERIAA